MLDDDMLDDDADGSARNFANLDHLPPPPQMMDDLDDDDVPPPPPMVPTAASALSAAAACVAPQVTVVDSLLPKVRVAAGRLATASLTDACASRGESSCGESLAGGSSKLRKAVSSPFGVLQKEKQVVDQRSALLMSLGPLGRGKSVLRKTPVKAKGDAAAAAAAAQRRPSVQASISAALDSRRAALDERDSMIELDESDDSEWD
jgi:hypothetical protein